GGAVSYPVLEFAMIKRSWIRNLFARAASRPIRKVQHRFRLALEVLEDRTVPSKFTGTSPLDDGSVGPLVDSSTVTSPLFSVGSPHIDPIRQPGLSSGGAALLPPTNLVYSGGPLIQNVQIQQIFFKDSQSGAETPYETQLDGFFRTITSDSYIPTLAGPYSTNGYTIGTGTVGAEDAHVPITSDAVNRVGGFNTISDSTIRNAIFNEIVNTHGTAPDNPNTLYCVFTPPGDVVTFGDNGTGGDS